MDRKTKTPRPGQDAEDTVAAPSPPEPEAPAWDAATAEEMVTAVMSKFRGLQHPDLPAQMRRLEFWREIGRLRKARDLPALRRVLAEFTAWMEAEEIRAAEFWPLERARIAARERAYISVEAPEGSVTGGHDYAAEFRESVDPPKRGK